MLDQTYHFWEKMTIKKDEPEVHPFFSLKQDDVQTDRQKFLGLESSDTILWLRRGCGPCNFHKTQWLCLGHPPKC